MRRRFTFFAVVLLAAFCLASGPATPPSPAEDGTLPALTAIAGHGMLDNHAYQDLEELSDYIGGRVTGSPQAAKAIEWGVAKMKSIGLTNVHTESWKLSRGWTRISANAELTAPINRRLSVDSLGWVGSTPASGAEGEVVPVNVNRIMDELKNAPSWTGKILLAVRKGEAPRDRSAAFGMFDKVIRAAQQAHAIAIIGGQGGSYAAGMHLTHTGAMGFDTYYDIPIVSMTAEDQQQLERFLDQGKTVRVRLNVQNRFSDGPVDSANVVGDIPGTEHPEQVVVVGGHLDSWDLASGTTDDGAGVVTTLGAAEAIVRSGQKPRRTLRFVLFTGEEQGLLGSLAYTKAHKDEMVNHVAALILDNGPGAVIGLNLGGHNDLTDAVQRFADSVRAFGDLKIDDRTSFGTDAGPFILAGLPGINMAQDSPEYRYTHHSVVDTFDKAKPDLITRDSTLMALTAFWIADRPERLASPWPPEKTAAMLVEKNQDKALKADGIWPFGDLGSTAKEKPSGSEQ